MLKIFKVTILSNGQSDFGLTGFHSNKKQLSTVKAHEMVYFNKNFSEDLARFISFSVGFRDRVQK